MTHLEIVKKGLEEISFPLVTEHPLHVTIRHDITDNSWTEKDVLVTSHKSIVDHEDRPIAVVGSGYTVVQNDDIYKEIEEAIYASAIDTTGMTRKITTSHLGARTIVMYTFPAHTIEVADGDNVCLTIKVLNSYDGSWRFMTLVGAVREICTNGMVIGEWFSEDLMKHTKNIDTDVAVEKLGHALEVYTKNAELWTAYPSTPVSDLQATNILMSLSGGSKTLLELLQKTHVQYVDELGKNLWALFNTLTDWSTHAKFKNEKNMGATIITREAKVRKVLPMLEALRKVA
jgi:hypothetical protein